MKKTLLLGAMALLIASAATATVPVKRSDAKVNRSAQLQRIATPNVEFKTNTVLPPGSPCVNKAPKREDSLKVWYDRPAGMFFVDYLSVDGSFGYGYGNPFLFAKPYTYYVYHGHVTGADDNTHMVWETFKDNGGDVYPYIIVEEPMDVHVDYGFEISEVPIFYAIDGDPDDPSAAWYDYQMKDYGMGGTPDVPEVNYETPVDVFSVPSDVMISENPNVDYWCSSKTMVGGGRNGDIYYTMTAYNGAEPYEGNENGWWFGKNGEHIDGMAQAFEKPTSPYLLKKVGLWIADSCTVLNEESVNLTCKVYKLNSIPAYNDTATVTLPEIPGELIVSGEAELNKSVLDDNDGFIEFTLYDHDEDMPELTYDYTPTIDCPILVVIDGYNDIPGLQDFTAYVSADDQVDEGYGELAYLKYPRYVPRLDENGDTVKNEAGETVYDFTGEYDWRGLNNFFRSGTMKTGFSIYISTENPFLMYNYLIEDGEYTFPKEGGELIKNVDYEGGTYQIEGIDFYSWVSYEDGDWVLSCDGVEKIPDWLDIKLSDVEGAENGGWEVHASVTAKPLPFVVKYREAIVRFGIPGDFIEYKFMQGEKTWPIVPANGDVNGDGSVNITDVNLVIEMILADTHFDSGDLDVDYRVTIADLHRVIAIILGGGIQPVW